jgi:hypothetical protein
MRVVALVALGVTTVAVAATHPGSAPASCAEAVRWGGTTYLGVGPSKRTLALGVLLSGGVEPGCRDTIPSPPVVDRPVRLRTIAGVSARVALVRADRPNRIFLAPGFLPQLRVGRREESVFVDVRTRVPHERGALPYFRAGTRVRLHVTECRRGSHFRYAVADRIDIVG